MKVEQIKCDICDKVIQNEPTGYRQYFPSWYKVRKTSNPFYGKNIDDKFLDICSPHCLNEFNTKELQSYANKNRETKI